MVVVVLVAVPAGVTMVVEVKSSAWVRAFVDMSVDVSVIVALLNTFIDVIAGVITVLADVVIEALTEVVIGALAGVVGVGMLADVDIIVMAAVSILLRFVVAVSHSIDVLWYAVVEAFIEALVGVRGDVKFGAFVPPRIGIDVLDGVNFNIFADVITTLRCVTPAPLREAFGCRTACSR